MTGRRWTLILVVGVVSCLLVIAAFASMVIVAPATSVPPTRITTELDVSDKVYNQPAPDWYAIENNSLVLHIDESRIVGAVVNNYPRFGPEGQRTPTSLEEATALPPLIEGRMFTAAQTLAAYNKQQEGWVGGYSTSVEFFDANGVSCGQISYNPSFPGDGVVVLAQGVIYQMNGDQTQVIEFLDNLVDSLVDQEGRENRHSYG